MKCAICGNEAEYLVDSIGGRDVDIAVCSKHSLARHLTNVRMIIGNKTDDLDETGERESLNIEDAVIIEHRPWTDVERLTREVAVLKRVVVVANQKLIEHEHVSILGYLSHDDEIYTAAANAIHEANPKMA